MIQSRRIREGMLTMCLYGRKQIAYVFAIAGRLIDASLVVEE
jgi:hypothetical protein